MSNKTIILWFERGGSVNSHCNNQSCQNINITYNLPIHDILVEMSGWNAKNYPTKMNTKRSHSHSGAILYYCKKTACDWNFSGKI